MCRLYSDAKSIISDWLGQADFTMLAAVKDVKIEAKGQWNSSCLSRPLVSRFIPYNMWLRCPGGNLLSLKRCLRPSSTAFLLVDSWLTSLLLDTNLMVPAHLSDSLKGWFSVHLQTFRWCLNLLNTFWCTVGDSDMEATMRSTSDETWKALHTDIEKVFKVSCVLTLITCVSGSAICLWDRLQSPQTTDYR